MSKVEVNTVEPQCGTTLTVGKCTTNLRSGGNSLQAADGGNLISQSGTDITLGASGDTVALASGASQTGFGRTGTVDWITTPKVTGDSPITGVTGKGYFMNTTAGTITINLPAGSAGDIISVADYAGTWQTYSVILSPNGSEKIGGINSNVSLNTEGQSVTLVYVDSTQGWVNTMDSTSNVRGDTYMIATVAGACNTLTTSGNCKVAKFVGPGTFCVSQLGGSAENNLVSYMVVAGGAGGGNKGVGTGETGGAGGAGGFRETKSPATPYTASPLDGYPNAPNRITVTASPYPITVGGGGPGAPGCAQPNVLSSTRNGSNSIFDSITSTGGGGGGNRGATTPSVGIAGGASGGSGGGGAYSGPTNAGEPGGAGNTPPFSPAQGFVGGNGPEPGGGGAGGAGGGATVAGAPMGPANGNGGLGGAGATTSISATPTAYAGGGGGGGNVPGYPGTSGGAGGTGGGGQGGDRSPTNPAGVAGTVNTGGGGGAGSGCGAAGGGGSGIVYIRYKFQ